MKIASDHLYFWEAEFCIMSNGSIDQSIDCSLSTDIVATETQNELSIMILTVYFFLLLSGDTDYVFAHMFCSIPLFIVEFTSSLD